MRLARVAASCALGARDVEPHTGSRLELCLGDSEQIGREQRVRLTGAESASARIALT